MADETKAAQEETDLSNQVATHYNKIEAGSIAKRTESRIFYLRNFNNWVKSVLIADAIYMLKRQGQDPRTMNVLDLASGKGGDQLKWKKAGVKHVVFADIAEVSMEHCRSRYVESANRKKFERDSNPNWPLFTAEFHVADCTKTRLRDRYENPDILFDLVSCQFSLHYAFESMSKARCMLRNAAENLRPGGLFFGTIPDAYEVVRRAREAAMKSEGGDHAESFGNDIYSVTFEKPIKATSPLKGTSFPLFGAKYHFALEGVVNCPEFLVYFPLLEELAREQDLELRSCLTFNDFFAKSIQRNDGRSLIGRMQALEAYPPQRDAKLMSQSASSYAAAAEWLRDRPRDDSGRPKVVGTISTEEWEAASLYLTFIFEKKAQEEAPQPSQDEARGEQRAGSDEDVPKKRAKLSDAPENDQSSGEERD